MAFITNSKLWRVALIALVVILVEVVTVTNAKECSTVSRGKELKKLVQNSHVLVALLPKPPHDDDDDDDDNDEENSEGEEDIKEQQHMDENYSELCERLQSTPEARVADFEIVLVTDPILQRKVWTSSRPAPQTWKQRTLFRLESYLPFLSSASSSSASASEGPSSFPEYVLFRQGTSYETGQGLQFVKTIQEQGEDQGETTTSSHSPSADAVSGFVASWLERQKLGNFVYSIGTYDLMAAQTMHWLKTTETKSKNTLVATLWVKGVVRLAKYLVQPTTTEFESALAAMYIKCANKVLEHGPDYPQSQVERLERLLGGGEDSSPISPLQREQLSQRLYIWKKFAEPITVSSDDFWRFLGRLALNLTTVLGVAILIPLVLLTREEEEDEDEDDEVIKEGEEPQQKAASNSEEYQEEDEEPIRSSPDVAKKLFSSEDNDGNSTEDEPAATTASPQPLTKKEKLDLAKQRAKASMEADKKRVEQTLAKKSQAGAGAAPSTQADASTYSLDDLNRLTVIQLRDRLRELGVKVTGNKAELVQRLAEAMHK